MFWETKKGKTKRFNRKDVLISFWMKAIAVAYMIVILVIIFMILGWLFLKIKDARRSKK